MNYPIKHTDLADDIATDDEQVTLIVIEAILYGGLKELKMSKGSDLNLLKEAVQNWSRFDEYSELISSQKGLLSRTISSSGIPETQLTQPQLAAANQIASNSFGIIKNEVRSKKRSNPYASVSIAACTLLVVFGISSFLNFNQGGTKSSSTRVASSDSKTSSDVSRNESKLNSKTEDQAGAESINPTSDQTSGVKSNDTSKESYEAKNNQMSSSATDSGISTPQILYLAGVLIASISVVVTAAILIRRKLRS